MKFKSKNLYENLEELPDKFKITYGDITLPAIKYVKNDIYWIEYDSPTRYTYLKIFEIMFKNAMIGSTTDYSCTINYIHKLENVSGTKLIQTILDFLKDIGVKQVFLGDDTGVFCQGQRIDLSLYLLLKKGITFYQRFGFEFHMSPTSFQSDIFKNDKEMILILEKRLTEFRAIKLQTFRSGLIKMFNLLTKIVTDNGYDKVKMSNYMIEVDYTVDVDPADMEARVADNVIYIMDLLNLVKPIKNITTLVELLMYYYDNKMCHKYSHIISYFNNMPLYRVSYGKTTLVNKYIEIFSTILFIRKCTLRLTFDD